MPSPASAASNRGTSLSLEARRAGLDDGQLVEVVERRPERQNDLDEVADTEIDFPVVRGREGRAA